MDRAVRYSPLILGGLFGEEAEAVSRSRLDAFAESGGRTIDTAPMYFDGRAEEVIGRWMTARRATVPREGWQIISKVCHPVNGRSRVRPEVIRDEVAGSLRRLRTDYLDAVLLHRDDPDVPVSAIVDTLLDLHDRNMIRQFGVSNWSAVRLAAFAEAVAPLRPIASYQFSLAVPNAPLWPDSRHAAADVLDVVVERKLCLQGWTALARGWFAGRNPDDHTGISRELLAPFDTAANRAARAAVYSVARKHNAAPIAVALNWMLSASMDVHAVVGPRSAEQLRECFSGLELTLTPVEWGELSRAAGVTSVPGPRSAGDWSRSTSCGLAR
ncbi:MAG TPA: aldo/keto reductase [Streptosporangiaceae bacterium]|nr:aldo/keto reductase [Streptosporangiaceae bacterium]